MTLIGDEPLPEDVPSGSAASAVPAAEKHASVTGLGAWLHCSRLGLRETLFVLTMLQTCFGGRCHVNHM